MASRLSTAVLVIAAASLLYPPCGHSLQESEGEGVREGGADLEEIDLFMERVLERRDVNWDEHYDYVFGEVVELEFGGSIDVPAIQSIHQEYSWFVRDGYLVRSPVSIDGVPVSDEYRADYEERWIRNRGRDDPMGSVDRDSFFGFEFKPGDYYYAGRREFEGREVVVVEYYPESLFADGGHDEEIDEMLDKTTLVTMLIDPAEHQIVRMTMDNVGLDFLPARWLVRIDDLRATMTMHKPLGDVWLVREISASASVSTAAGNLSVSFSRRFFDYRRATTRVRYRFAPRAGGGGGGAGNE